MLLHEWAISGIGILMTGLLSLLWWDIRDIRGEAATFRKDRQKLKDEIDEKYLAKEAHQLMCQNSILRMEVNTAKVVQAAAKDIMAAIKQNGGGG